MDQGSFTPLVFAVAGGIGRKGIAFYSRRATLLSLKNGIEKSKVTSWKQLIKIDQNCYTNPTFVCFFNKTINCTTLCL